MGMVTVINNCERVFVCGGGHQGLSMASHLALNGVAVTLWNRTQSNITEVIRDGVIHCNGIVEGSARIERASSNLEDVISDFIMITTPSTAHKDIARKIAPYVSKNTVIVLNPGRTFGAIEFARTLLECGVRELPQIAETQTIVYTCRRSGPNSVSIYALKNQVEIAAIKGSDMNYIMSKMPKCLAPCFKAVPSVAQTSFSNVGMILHVAPVLMNIGWIESEKVDFKYYYDGISESIASFLEKVDRERVTVAAAMGYSVESVADWMRRIYRVNGEDLFHLIKNNEAYTEIDAPPSIRSRYITEDVPNGLVPIELIGRELNIKTPNISLLIDMASSIMNEDYREIGRRISLGVLREFF